MTPAPDSRDSGTQSALVDLSPQAQARARSLLVGLHAELDRSTRFRVRSRRITACLSFAALSLFAWIGLTQFTHAPQTHAQGEPVLVNARPESAGQSEPNPSPTGPSPRFAAAPGTSAGKRLSIREVTNRPTAFTDLTTDQLIAQLRADGSRMGLLIVEGKAQIVLNRPVGPAAEHDDQLMPDEQH